MSAEPCQLDDLPCSQHPFDLGARWHLQTYQPTFAQQRPLTNLGEQIGMMKV
jgi:hypothetical protein